MTANGFIPPDDLRADLADDRPTAVMSPSPNGAIRFQLLPSYPNPFNARTTIRYSLRQPSDVRLVVYDMLGQQIRVLEDGVRYEGIHTVVWDGRDDDGRELASGGYLYRLRTGDGQQMETRKLLLLR